MATCSKCHAEIDNGQAWTYYSCCPGCYDKLKARRPKILFPLGVVYVAIGATAMMLAILGDTPISRLVGLYILIGVSFSISGTSTLYRAWQWKTTVVVRDLYNYKVLAIQTIITATIALVVMAIPVS